MGELQKYRNPATVQPNMTRLAGTIVIGAAGAVASQTDTRNGGVTFVKNAAAGRYDAVVHKGYRRVMSGDANVCFPTIGQVPVATDGNEAYITGIPAASFGTAGGFGPGTAAAPAFAIQCITSNGTPAAANPPNGSIVSWELFVSESP